MLELELFDKHIVRLAHCSISTFSYRYDDDFVIITPQRFFHLVTRVTGILTLSSPPACVFSLGLTVFTHTQAHTQNVCNVVPHMEATTHKDL